MIKIQGIEIRDHLDAEGLAGLVDSMACKDWQPEHIAEKLFGLMVLLDKASADDKNVIIERVMDFAYLHTKQGRAAIKALSETILDS